MLSVVRTALFYLVEAIELLILARCLVSWLPIDRSNKIINFLYQVTEPLLAPVRNLLSRTPLGRGGFMLDLSPIIVFFVLQVVVVPLIRLL